MKLAGLLTLALSIAASSASAQHPRTGQLAELTFEPGSAGLGISTEQIAPNLGEVAAWALEHPDGLIVLDGHADRTGPSSMNVQLSMQRARTVRNELVAIGVDPEMIVIAAFGEDGSASRTGNDRRVVVWGTRSGLDSVVARTRRGLGHAVIWSGIKTPTDRATQPGAVVSRR